MTQNRDIERLLDVWLADGPTQVSDRVFDDVVERLDREGQRPAWRFLTREIPMSSPLKVALAAAAVIVAIGSGVLIFGRPNGEFGTNPATPTPSVAASPSASPSPTVAASPSSSATACDDPAFGCAGPLSAGAHATVAFKPSFDFHVPANWANTLDRSRAYLLKPPNAAFTFQVLSELAIPGQNADCTPALKPGVGNSVADWVTFLTQHPGLTASKPTTVSVGGYQGKSVSFAVAPTWKQRCPRSIGPAVVILTDSGTPPTRLAFVDDQQSTFTILDVAGTTVIIRLESGPSPAAHARDQQAVQPIIDSMQFHPTS